MADHRFLIPHTPENSSGGYVVYESDIFPDPNNPGQRIYYTDKAPIQFGMHTYADYPLIHQHLPFKCKIGNYCAIAKNVGFMGLQTHRYDVMSVACIETFPTVVDDKEFALEKNRDEITIENDVWIGHGAMLLPGAHIPNGTVIGANSVVSKKLEPFGIYVGNPAKLIKFRFDDIIIEKLLKVSWWNYTVEQLDPIKSQFFSRPEISNSYNSEFFDYFLTESMQIKEIQYKKNIIAVPVAHI
jgi:acetyltransferase-like isoleucine patch superfamily enzyme